jgi:hypothetical protein
LQAIDSNQAPLQENHCSGAQKYGGQARRNRASDIAIAVIFQPHSAFTELLRIAHVTQSPRQSNQIVKDMHIETIAKKPSNANQVNWITAFFMAAFHIGAIAALFFFAWKALLVAALLWVDIRKLGDWHGLPRLLTHRGYKWHDVIGVSV